MIHEPRDGTNCVLPNEETRNLSIPVSEIVHGSEYGLIEKCISGKWSRDEELRGRRGMGSTNMDNSHLADSSLELNRHNNQ